MPTLVVKKSFRYSPDGVTVVEYPPGEHEVDDRCAEIAEAEGWGRIKTDRRRKSEK